MAIVSVDTDLSVANGGTINDATSITNWGEPTASGTVSGQTYTDMKSIQTEPDVYIEGTGCISGAWTTNAPERGGIIYNSNGVTVPTDGAIMVWAWWIAPLSLNPYSTGGLVGLIGNAQNQLTVYKLSGNDHDPAPIGGWYCYPINPSNTTSFYEYVGSAPTGTINWVGAGLGGPGAQSRGLTHFAVDAIRVGRCKVTVVGGTGADTDATFNSIVTGLEGIDSGKFGIFDSQYGSYFMQGFLQLGDSTSGTGEIDFTDSNKVINIRNTPAVTSNFNRIEFQNGSTVTSNILMTGITFNNIGIGGSLTVQTESRGDVIAGSTVNLDLIGCSFNDLGTFTFGSGTTITDTIFRRCDIITPAGATMTSCNIQSPNNTTAGMSIDTPSDIVNCSSLVFDLNNVNNTTAIRITGNTSTDYSFSGHKFNNLGTTGSYAVTYTGTGNITISPSNGSNITQAMVTSSGGGTITVNAVQTTLYITNLYANSEVRIHRASDGTELGGTENATTVDPDNTGRYRYTHTYTTQEAVYVVVMNYNYQHLSIDYTLDGTDGAKLLVSQVIDRNYVNP